MIFRITKFIYILFIFKTFPHPQTTFQIRKNEYQHSHASAAFDIFRDYFSTSSSQYLFVLVYKIIVRVHKIIVRVYKIIILLALIIIKDIIESITVWTSSKIILWWWNYHPRRTTRREKERWRLGLFRLSLLECSGSLQ